MEKKLTTSQIVIVAGGVAALLGSFLPWASIDAGIGGDLDFSAWDEGLFPTYTWIAIFGVVMALQVVLTTFASMSLPDRVMGFTWPQLHLILGFVAALLAVSFLIVDKPGDTSIGFFLSLLGAAALVVGAVMLGNETTAPGPGPGPGPMGGPSAPPPPPPI